MPVGCAGALITAYVNVSHVFLTAIKSKVRASTQEDMCKFMTDMREFGVRMSEDASFMLDAAGDKLFGDDTVLYQQYNLWSQSNNNRILIDKLYEPNPPTRDLTITMLQAFGTAMVEQIDRNSSEYLAGGVIFDVFNCPGPPTLEQQQRRDHLLSTPLSADSMERVFGVLDYSISNTANMSLQTASGITAYRLNKTEEWLRSLHPRILNLVCNICRRMFAKTLKERRDNFNLAVEGKHQLRLTDKAEADRKRHNKIRNMMRYDMVDVFLDITSFRDWLRDATATHTVAAELDKAILSCIR